MAINRFEVYLINLDPTIGSGTQSQGFTIRSGKM